MSPAPPLDRAARLTLLAQRLKRGCRPQDLLEGLEPRQLAADLEAASAALGAEAPPGQPPSPAPEAPPAAQASAAAPAASGLHTLYCDGGSRGNPGPAGCGAVLLDPAGRQVGGWRQYLGRATNNHAEYQALILGLTQAAALGVRELTVLMDSELLVRQINGQYQVKSPQLKPLFEQARQLLAGFAQTKVRHIPRAQNSQADALANQAMDLRG